MPKVNIDIGANFGDVSKGVRHLERQLSGLQKTMGRAFNGGAATTRNSPLAIIARQMKDLERQAEQTKAKLGLLSGALTQVNAQQSKLGGLNVIGRQAQARDLDIQSRTLQRQIATAQTRLNIIQQMQTAGGTAPAGGAPGAPGTRPGIGRFGGLQSFMGEAMRQFLGPMAMIGTAAGAAALLHKAYETAATEEKSMADILPRVVRGGGVGNTHGALGRIRGIGRPLGFTGHESLQVLEAMSAGGSHLGRGLERDTQASMLMARMFGIDAGQQAGMLATAQRTGAFKPGDAKKFAEMLAREISHTGLGPRAAEVQEATLQLLHNQLRTLPNATPGGIMALQTVFNKTGQAGFQGTAGASLMQTINQHIQNPQGEAQDAYLQSVYFRENPNGSFYDYQLWKERALSDKAVLPGIAKHLRRDFGGGKAAAFQAKGLLGTSMHQYMALAPNLTAGNVNAAAQALSGSGMLERGAGAAMGLTGNKLRRMEAGVDEVLSRGGGALVPFVAKFGDWATKELEGILNIVDSSQTTAEKITTIADRFLGAPADRATGGALSSPGFWKNSIQGVGGLLGPMGSWLGGRLGESLFPGEQDLGKGEKWQSPVKRLAESMGLRMTSHVRHGKSAVTVTGKKSLHASGQAMDFKGTPDEMAAFFDAVQNQYGGNIRELFYTPRGSIKDNRYYPAGSFNPKVEGQHFDHVHVALGEGDAKVIRHIVEEHGVVSESSRRALRSAIKSVADEQNRNQIISKPNRR